MRKIQENYRHKKYFVLPFTIDINKYELSSDKQFENTIAYLGALDWIPNQEGLIWFLENVWDKIESVHSDTEFYIAGRNTPDWLEKKILSHRVKFLGEVSDAKKYIQEHQIFVVPLLSGSGMRIKLIEQMALERIVIATSIAAEGIDVSHGANGFICNTSEEYIFLLRDLLNGNIDGNEISANARQTIQDNFDEITAFDNLKNFLTTI
jgi:glycosyltransferase involved in cell wall biosynthesis